MYQLNIQLYKKIQTCTKKYQFVTKKYTKVTQNTHWIQTVPDQEYKRTEELKEGRIQIQTRICIREGLLPTRLARQALKISAFIYIMECQSSHCRVFRHFLICMLKHYHQGEYGVYKVDSLFLTAVLGLEWFNVEIFGT